MGLGGGSNRDNREYYVPSSQRLEIVVKDERRPTREADPVDAEIRAFGRGVSIHRDGREHPLSVSFDGELVHVGCTTLTERAWRNLSKLVEKALEAKR
jgi:hypothetical protein